MVVEKKKKKIVMIKLINRNDETSMRIQRRHTVRLINT
jgi:hypothetical protein